MPNRKGLRNAFVYLLILVIAVAIFLPIFIRPESGPPTDIGTIIDRAQKGEISMIEVQGDAITATLTSDGKTKLQSRKESSVSMQQLLETNGIKIGNGPSEVKLVVKEPSQFGEWFGLLINFLPLVLFGGLLLFMMRQGQNAGNQAFSFGKSKARMFGGNKPTVTFADVAGVEEAKQELQEVVEFLKYPERFAALGARIPRGVLLVGPPGTGKTLMAKAVAGEAGVPFFSISGSEFVEMFVGVGASRVRDLFDQAKRNAPCIVFVDEIDAVGRQRGAGLGGSHDEREQTLNQILVEMDGFDTNTNVIVIAATNRPDILDPALLRPGRFDRQVVLDRPDIGGRKQILEVHARGKPFDRTVDLETIAKQTPGFSGADLANLLNEAAILAARRNKKLIGMDELEEAVDRVIAGPERKSRVITQRERLVTAYHEAGHAVVAHGMAHVDPVHKISVVSRGMMGGYTRILPTEDRYLYTRGQFKDMLAWALGGHVAEKLRFGEVTTGAENDLDRATTIARRMVMEYGMSDKLGPRAYGRREELVFLGREITETKNYSEQVAEEIDGEIHALIDEAYKRANEVLNDRRAILDNLAEVLTTRETIEGDALQAILDGVEAVEAEPAPAPTV
ncbi:MAG: ATP-dependent zinc metalloprotease FtsH [Dehalococcoidia bacterium]